MITLINISRYSLLSVNATNRYFCDHKMFHLHLNSVILQSFSLEKDGTLLGTKLKHDLTELHEVEETATNSQLIFVIVLVDGRAGTKHYFCNAQYNNTVEKCILMRYHC